MNPLNWNNTGPQPSAGDLSLPRGFTEACREFLKSMAQTMKVFFLYKASHPVAAGALGETYNAFDALLRIAPSDEFTINLVDDRWLVNGTPVAEASQLPDILKAFFRSNGLHSLTFMGDVRFYELSALCEMAASTASPVGKTSLANYLAQRGIKRIRVNSETYLKADRPFAAPARPPLPQGAAPPVPQRAAAPVPPRAAPPMPPRAVPPMPPRAAPQAPQASLQPTQAPARAGGNSFGSILKGLIENAVSDPEERTHI